LAFPRTTMSAVCRWPIAPGPAAAPPAR